MSGGAGLPELTVGQLALLTGAWLLGILPLVWTWEAKVRDRRTVGVAVALAVSFVADGSTIPGLDADVVSNTYLFLQGALLVRALLDWETALSLTALYAVTAVGSILYEGATGFNLWLPTVVGVSVCWIAWRWAAPLRWSLMLTFGGGLISWAYWAWLAAHSPALATRGWWCFQAARLLGVLAFMAATWPTRVRSGCGCPA